MTARTGAARLTTAALALVALLAGLVVTAGPAAALTATTTSVVTAPTTQARAGSPVTLSATIAAAAATGTVQFSDNGSSLGSPVSVSAGVATLTTSALTAGSHQITAAYSGDATYAASDSTASPIALQVVTVRGQLTLNPQSGTNFSAPDVSLYTPSGAPGCPVGSRRYRAVLSGAGVWTPGFLVIPNSTIPGSSVSSGGGDFTGPFQDTFAGIAASNSVPLAAGQYDLTVYCTNNLGSTYYGAFTTSLWFTGPTAWQSTQPGGVPTPTTTSLAASPVGTAAAGSPVTLTATVSPSVPGTVTFSDTTGGTTTLGTAPVVAGQATLITSALAAGAHSFTAAFSPLVSGAQAASSSSAVAYTVTSTGPQATTTTLGVSPAGSAPAGQSVTITATLSPSSAVGSVQFSDNGSPLGSAVAVSGGTATLTTSALSQGSHSFTAAFTPTDSNAYGASSTASPTTYNITAPSPTATTTGLGVLPVGSAAVGATVTITATLSPSSAVGSVQFSDSGSPLGSAVAVSGGTATLTTSALSLGSHSFTAAFTPTDSNAYGASSTASPTAYTITAAAPTATTTVLAVGPAGTTTVALGQTVTLTATLTPSGAAGSVQFTDNGSPIGSPRPVAAGTASLSWSSLVLGAHNLGAAFTPTDSSTYSSSTSATVARTVINPRVLGGVKTYVSASNLAFGTASDPMTIETVSSGVPAGCQKLGTSGVSARAVITGPEGWASGIVVVGTTTAGVSSTADFDLPLADTLSGIAASNSISIVAGRYDITIECRQNSGVTGTFASPIWFTDTTNWQSTDPNGSATVTTVTLVVTPDGSQFQNGPVTLTATVSPSSAVGSVQFTNTIGGSTANVGSGVAVSGGQATLTTSSLAVGMYTFGATFVPTNVVQYLGSSSSAVTYLVRLPDPPAPLTPTTLTGTAAIGRTLTCVPGTWSNSPTSQAISWLRNGVAIPGATSATYVVKPTDGGTTLACRVSATNGGGTISSTSVAKAVPFAPASRAVKAPAIVGVAKVGKRLTLKVGTWTPKPTSYAYQWLRNGKAIVRATRAAYVLTRADKGKRISCLIIAKRVGALPGRATTRAVVVR